MATREERAKVNPLADISKPAGKIRFIHFRDGTEHTFYSCVNRLSGNRLSAFDSDPPSVDDPIDWVKSVFRDIRKKATSVVECIGDF